MNILAVGDVVGNDGCQFVREVLPSFKKLKNIDVCIINGENSAEGNGISPESAEHLFASGADVITTGNHAFQKRSIYDYYDEHSSIIRPANFPSGTPGKGMEIIDKGRVRIAVINLLGVVYLKPLANPFECVTRYIEKAKAENCKFVLLDFHAEATSEKRAMGFFVDGKISAMFGTHTHTQTSDEQILPNGTGYITDLGMSGSYYSVLGIAPEIIIEQMQTQMPARYKTAGGEQMLEGCIFTIDENTGKTTAVERVQLR